MEMESYYIGQLASETKLMELSPNLKNVKINDSNQLQFYIQINNTLNLPDELLKKLDNTFVSCFESNIVHEDWGSEKYNNYFREDEFRDFAKDKVFIFKVVLEERRYGDKILRVKKNSLIIRDRPNNILSNEDNTFIPVPIFKDFSLKIFENHLLENKSIGKFDALEKISSPFIISAGFLYGEFMNFEKLNDGWYAYYDENIKKVSIDFEKYLDDILITEHAIYMDENFMYEIFGEILLENNGKNLMKDERAFTRDSTEFVDERIKENQFIDKLIINLKNEKLVYDYKQIINFHTALKTKRLVILSGPSGTGKSKLVEIYAKNLGLDQTQLNIISVKPNWTEDSDLIGYYDSINNIYVPSETGLIDTLIKASENTNQMYIVCFDEMNLAKVEHYFSQFLSVLEYEGSYRKLTLYNKSLLGRVFNSDRYQREIMIGDNVLFVGTINIDESTNVLSDKVLDRSNLIELNNPPNHINLWIEVKNNNETKTEKKDDIEKIDTNLFNEWCDWQNKSFFFNEEVLILTKINELFYRFDKNTGLGFRTINHINSYLANLPKDSEHLSRKQAFDFQIAQKLLPKLRGSREEIDDIFFNEDFGMYSFLDEKNFPTTYKLLKRKERDLSIYGYTN